VRADAKHDASIVSSGQAHRDGAQRRRWTRVNDHGHPADVRHTDTALGPPALVFLLDVDNTLLDNDGVTADLRQHMIEAFGAESQERYWQIFESLRTELGYADYLGALQRYRVEHPNEPHLMEISFFLVDYPFQKRLYPGALEAIARLRERGTVAILSDGDVVFQPRKIARSGLWRAVDGAVLIYIHKEDMLADVERRYPAQHYVMVDDKLRVLTAIKKLWGHRVTTVFVRQGHYAADARALAAYPAADVTIERIGDLDKSIGGRVRRRSNPSGGS
jgi:FMN phosphatase YigB (HAD superfamily)